MRLIDADKCWDYFYEHLTDADMAGAINAIEEMPTVNALEVVRCKDCKWFVTYPNGLRDCIKINEKCSPEWELCNDPEDYCSYGERKDVTNRKVVK